MFPLQTQVYNKIKPSIFWVFTTWLLLLLCADLQAQLPLKYQGASSADVLALVDQGNLDSALVLAEVLLEFSDSTQIKIHALNNYSRGMALMKSYDFDKAQGHFIQASKLMQGQTDSLKYDSNVQAANCLTFSGDNDSAMYFLEQNLAEE